MSTLTDQQTVSRLLVGSSAAVVCALLCLRLLNSWRRNRNQSRSSGATAALHPIRLPPGPKGLPLIGNFFDMPKTEEWKTAREWGEKYGPVVYVENFGTPYIFLNTYQACVDLFEKRGANFSSRPDNTMVDLQGWKWFPALMPYGEELKRSRQLLHRFFEPRALGNYRDLQTRSIHKMLDGLLKTPDRFIDLIRRSSGEMILMISYGYQAKEKDDPYITLAEKGMEAFAEAEGFFLVNAFPWLRYLPAWFPGAEFQKIAKEGYKHSMAMYREPYKMAKEAYLNGMAVPSMLSKLLEALLSKDEIVTDETLIARITGVTYAGGADTTISAMSTFFLAMLLYPEVQRRAQEELDRVVGKDNLPSFDDRPNLPYIEAVCKESLRWQIVSPLGMARTADKDDEYNGHFIPASAAILPNLWAILNDPAEFPEPDEFIPDRWLPAEGKEPPLDVAKVVFGIGRRICPGRYFALNSIFLGVSSVLTCFDISKATGDNGQPITPPVDYSPSFIRHPKPFKYVLTPRSEKIGLLVRHAVESAE